MPTRNKQTINSVLFDLDGTLLDTAPDLTHALNYLLKQQGMNALASTSVRSVISEGVRGLLKLGFNIDEKDTQFAKLQKQFLNYYSEHTCIETKFFPQIEDLIYFLKKNNYRWGIVTNKTISLTEKLLSHFSLLNRADCIVAGDTLEFCKPHPKPLLHACQCLGSSPDRCVYIGDAKRDIDAANAAGMDSLIASYGYIPANASIETWCATGIISSPSELISWLKGG